MSDGPFFPASIALAFTFLLSAPPSEVMLRICLRCGNTFQLDSAQSCWQSNRWFPLLKQDQGNPLDIGNIIYIYIYAHLISLGGFVLPDIFPATWAWVWFGWHCKASRKTEYNPLFAP